MSDFRKRFWYVAVWLGFSLAPLVVALSSDTVLMDEILKETYRSVGGSLYFDYNFHKYYLAALRIPLIALGFFSLFIPLVFALAVRLWPLSRSNPFERLYKLFVKIPLPFLFLVAFGCVLVFAYAVLCDFANSADEWSFLFQADTFAQGKVFKEAKGLTDKLLFSSHVRVTDGKIYSLMFPGWPLMLSLGTLIGLPGMVNPLISVIALFFIYRTGSDNFDRKTGVLSAVLCLLSLFFLFNSGSYFSHPAGLLWGMGSVFFFLRAITRTSKRSGFFAGLFLGFEALARPYDAAAIGLPMAAFGLFAICRNIGLKKGLVLSSLFIAGASIGAAGLLAYNDAITGSPWIAPLHYSGASIRPGFEQQPYHIHTVRDGLLLTFSHMTDLIAFMPAASLLFLAPVFASKKRFTEWFLLAEAAAIVAAYSAYPAYGGNQYGPRYYYSGLGFLAILLARGALLAFDDAKHRFGNSGAFGFSFAGILALSFTLAGAIAYAVVEHDIVKDRMQPFTMVKEQGISNAFVQLENGAGTAPNYDLIRNFDYDDPVLYVRWIGDTLKKAYPDRDCYNYRYGGTSEPRDFYQWPPERNGDKSVLEKIPCRRE